MRVRRGCVGVALRHKLVVDERVVGHAIVHVVAVRKVVQWVTMRTPASWVRMRTDLMALVVVPKRIELLVQSAEFSGGDALQRVFDSVDSLALVENSQRHCQPFQKNIHPPEYQATAPASPR